MLPLKEICGDQCRMPDEIGVCLITLGVALQFTFWGIFGCLLFFYK